MADTSTAFDPEVITARILAQELRDMIKRAQVTPAWVGKVVGTTDHAILAWLRGANLKQPVRLFAAIEALGYDVVFRRRSAPPRFVRLRSPE